MRPRLLTVAAIGAALVGAIASACAAGAPSARRGPSAGGGRPNVLLVTMDDLQWDSLGATGCSLSDITPNLDRFASEGLRFHNAFVNVAVCQPSREAFLTGRFPHRSGALGFLPIADGIPTLPGELSRNGYLVGAINKLAHMQPSDAFGWDFAHDRVGNRPERYYALSREFIEQAHAARRPFFLNANITDPHRPFSLDIDALRERIGDAGVEELRGREHAEYVFTEASRYITADEVEVPGFLTDLQPVRNELAGYFTGVHRGDESVGEILRALDESGERENTLVLFLSDHGMPFPFSKSNCYPGSVRTPLIVRWPGTTDAGAVDTTHFISGVDLVPTILEAVGLAPLIDLDGRSFVRALAGESQPELDAAFTFYNISFSGDELPMRGVLAGRYCYIYNGWNLAADEYRCNLTTSSTWRAMLRASSTNAHAEERVGVYAHRPLEELFDCVSDPDALVNLADRPEFASTRAELRARVSRMMRATDDPLLSRYMGAISATVPELDD